MTSLVPATIFQSIIEKSDQLYVMTTPQGQVYYANSRSQGVFGACVDQGYDFFTCLDDPLPLKTANLPWSGVVCLCDCQKETRTFQVDLEEFQQEDQTLWVWSLKERVQESASSSGKRLDGLIDNMPAYVFSKDPQGRYTYVNKMLAMLHNRPAEDILGKTDYELFPEQAAQEFTKNDARVFEQGQTVRVLEKDDDPETGIDHHYLSVKCPLHNEEGEVIELLGMSIDMSEQYRLERAFRENQEKLNSILDNVSARVYIKDQNLNYTYANEHLCREMGRDRSDILGKNDLDLFDSKTAAGYRATDMTVLDTLQKRECLEISEAPFEKDRRYFWSIKVPLLDADGNAHAVLGISTDISAQKRLETALRAKEEQLTTILDNLKAHVYIKDINATYTYVNHDLCDYVGKSREEIIGHTDVEVFGEKAAQRFRKADDEVFNYRQNKATIEKSRDFKTGKKRYFWSVKVPLINDWGNPYALLGISTDVTEQKRLEKQLRVMATTDALTGVHNRGSFINEFKRELKRASRYDAPMALIMLDVDHFKHINDTHGHAVGDEAIIAMTALCRNNLRETDILGRIGGEEFAIILPEADLEGARQIAERIRKSAENYAFDAGDNTPCRFTASFGLTARQSTDQEPDDLLKRADLALYDAKSQGRNLVCGRD